MFCVRNIQRSCISMHIKLVPKVQYFRCNDRNTSSFKVVQSDDVLNDIESTVFGLNPNWELLTPQGFRFYLPGSIGPGWLDASTTAQVEIRSFLVPDNIQDINISQYKQTASKNVNNKNVTLSLLRCTAQECPTLLRKGILELFPSCLEVTSPQLTIVTISQKISDEISKWSKETKIEKLAQYFVLAASDICRKLKACGYWADFINPFSGQPYLNPKKNKALYQTDERFRCVGFKVEQHENCKIIVYDNSAKNFIGNLYTTAPWSTELLKEIIDNVQ